MIWLILFLLPFLVVGFFFVRSFFNKKELCKNFSEKNCIVFGKKGSGKDLLFQCVINSRRLPYYSNVDYGGSFSFASPSFLELPHNTYKNFISGQVVEEVKPNYENVDFYFSDCGIILPSQYDSTLYKLYPSFCISYALSRHLYNNNIHVNTQALGRVWKALREQADFYICCKKSFSIFGFIITKYITYTNYDSALSGLSPLSARSFNKFSKTEYDKYIALNGIIKNCFVIQRKKNIKYDTRIYHNYLFGFSSPKHEKKSFKFFNKKVK